MAIKREQVVQTAEKYVSRGKIEPAIREYRKLLEENPNDINTLNRVGDLYARIQRIDEAVDFFNQIAEQYATEGFFVKAIAIYKKIIKLDPTRLDVYESLAELYHRQGLVTEARTQYQVLADYYQKHENATSAIAIYQKMADLEPANPTYHVKLAELYQQQRLIDKAMGEYKVIAELMLQHGHALEAAQVYERALLVDCENLPFITDAAIQLKATGGNAVASRFLAAAIERNPAVERVVRLVGVSDDGGGAATAALERSVVRQPPAPPRASRPPVTTAMPRPAEPPPPPAWEPEADEGVLGGGGLPEVEAVPDSPMSLLPPSPAPEPDEIELDLDMDMDQAGVEPLAAGPAFEPAPPVGRAPAGEDVFILDMEDDAEPLSLVKPPPDMLRAPGRPAWALDGRTAVPPPPAPAEAEAEAEAEESRFELVDPFAGFDELPNPFASAELAPPDTMELLRRLPSDYEPEPAEAPHEQLPVVPLNIDSDLLEKTAAEVQPQTSDREEDLVSEAEVLAKYGLKDKAMERLRDALRTRPNHLGAYALLIHLQLEKGRHQRVADLAQQMWRAAASSSDRDLWPKMRKRLLAAGYRLEDDRVLPPLEVLTTSEADEAVARAAAALLAPPPASKPAPPAGELTSDLAARLDLVTGKAKPRPAAAPDKPARRRRTGEIPIERELEGLLEQAPKRRPQPVRPVEPEAPAAPGELLPIPSEADLDFELPPIAAAAAASQAGRLDPGAIEEAVDALSGEPVIFNPLEIGEMVEREEMDWSREGTAGAGDFLGQTEAEPPPAVRAEPRVPAAPRVPPVAASDGAAGLDDTGMSWLDEADAGRGKGPAKAASFFDEEQDFFDLAGELEQELSKEDAFQGEDLLLQPAEQSLEEIVEGFKRGVAEHLSPTDYDTHFNLGIAYREMGLLDEAIGEFQLAAKDDRYLVPCCSMLGLCFLDKGIPELAIKWYRRGLEAPRLSEEDTLGLLYDLGCVYVQMGDKDEAYKTFVEVYGINTNYRDVVARIEELGNPH